MLLVFTVRVIKCIIDKRYFKIPFTYTKKLINFIKKQYYLYVRKGM